MSKYYQPEIETMDREELRKLQNDKFLATFKRVYENVEYYRNLCDEKGIKPDDIKSIDDLHLLPFITKDDLRECYPDGLLACPRSECVRIHSTSGTTGKRVVAFYTQNDIDLWEDCCARALTAAGADSSDTVQICYGYGLFTGGLGLHGGAQKIQALALPMSSGNTERQIQFMSDLGSTVLCCTPSYAEYLGEIMKEQNLNETSKLKAGIFGAEAWTQEMREGIEKSLGIKAYDIYGLTELSGPGVSFECEEQKGMHINEDHFIAEIINPDTGEVLPMGEKGELVFTSIDKEAFPLIRYRTKDICVLDDTPCSCGRTFIRMAKPMGRSDDMLIIRGVNVFPSQIEAVLIQEGYGSNYQIIVSREHHSDKLDLYVEMNPDTVIDTVKGISAKEKELVGKLKIMLGIVVAVHLTPPKTIERNVAGGKVQRVIDNRNLY